MCVHACISVRYKPLYLFFSLCVCVCVFLFFFKLLINELLKYKGLMLIPMVGVIVSRLSSNSFEELSRPEMH